MSITTMNFVPSPTASASRRMVWTAISLAAVSLLSVSAHAAEELPQATVDYADLNLSAPADASKLYSRLQRAAKEVCGSVDRRDFRMRRLQQECYRQALASAVANVDHTAVTALFHSDKSIRLASRRSDDLSQS